MRIAALVALAAFALYLASFRSIVSVDAASNVLLSYSLVRDGDAFLDEYRADYDRISYWAEDVRGHDVIDYQPGTAMFAAPFTALGVLLGIEPPMTASVTVIGKLAAAAAAAGSVFFVCLAAARLAGRRIAVAVAALYAFGTVTWPVSGGGLWHHGPAQLFVAMGLFLLLCRDPLWQGRSGLAFGLAYLVRYHTAVFGVAALATLFARDRGTAGRFVLWGLPALALQMTHDVLTYGQLLVTRITPYRETGDRVGAVLDEIAYSASRDLGSVVEAAAGLLVSPSRGLLVYSPFLALGAYEIVRRIVRRDPLARVLGPQLGGSLAVFAMYSMFHEWWGGYTYGNRYVAESLPLLALGTALWARRMRGHPLAMRGLAVTGAIGVAIAAVGATVYDWRTWSWEANAPFPELVWRIDLWQPLYTAINAGERADALTLVTALVALTVGIVLFRLWSGSPGSWHGGARVGRREGAIVTAALLVALLVPGGAAAQETSYIDGYVRTSAGAPIQNVCVTIGVPTVCSTATDATGYYRFDGFPVGETPWETYYTKEGYAQARYGLFHVNGPTRIDITLVPGTSSCPRPSSPVRTIYLPNVTKTFGGPTGWQTPFIVQNVDPYRLTALDLEFYRFSDGALVGQRQVCVVRPGTSYAFVPNSDAGLPDSTQFSVVVRSWHADAVAVVNEHQGSGSRAEAASYVGASSGATTVSLPNIVKTFFGFVTPFIIQNLGTATTTARAEFVSFDGTHTATLFRTIGPGRSQYIDPNSEPSLRDQTQYGVTVTSDQPLSVVVNTHNDAPTVARPVVYAANGVTGGASTLLGPYAVKNVSGVGKGISTIVVQNLGVVAIAPTMTFRPLGGGAPTTFTLAAIGPGASRAFDPRHTDGDTSKALCGAGSSAGCLADGEYSFVAAAAGGSLSAVVNVIGSETAAGYSAIGGGASRVYMPNVTRTLGGSTGWTTPIVVQSDTATGATLRWYRFSDGALVTTQTVSLSAGVSAYVDPRSVASLSDGTQYSVVAEGTGGTIAAIVVELNFQGGDGAMTYEGFPR